MGGTQEKTQVPEMISDNARLSRFCERMRSESFVTVDTEFMREKTYWPELCIVQIGGEHEVALIDACAPNLDLTLLRDLFAEPSCLKVFHAARQDLEIFFHLFGCLPTPLFDTQIGAMVCGYGDQIGYDALVNRLTGRSIDKAHRFSDWARRPLTSAQIAYAAADVTHLRTVFLKLRGELETSGRASWVDSELSVILDPKTYQADPRRQWERLKLRTNNRRLLGVLQEVAAWREIEAQARNIPRQRVIRDESLIEIASSQPLDKDSLMEIRGITKGWVDSHNNASILDAIRTGLSHDDIRLPQPAKKPARGGASTAVVALLKVLLLAKSEEHHVSPKVVASSEDIERLIAGDKNCPVLHGWRRKLFGEAALELISGDIALTMSDEEVHLTRVKSV